MFVFKIDGEEALPNPASLRTKRRSHHNKSLINKNISQNYFDDY